MVPKVIKKWIKNLKKNYKKWEASWVSFWVSTFLYIEIAGLRHFLPSLNFVKNLLQEVETHFGTLCLPLGSFLGPLEVSWEASGPKNVKKTEGFLMVLKRLFFGL